MDTLYIDGRSYHAQIDWTAVEEAGMAEVFDDLPDTLQETFLVLVLAEDGEPIPKPVCICAAHNDSECCCGAWSGVYDDELVD